MLNRNSQCSKSCYPTSGEYLKWNYRKNNLLENIKTNNFDILCVQVNNGYKIRKYKRIILILGGRKSLIK